MHFDAQMRKQMGEKQFALISPVVRSHVKDSIFWLGYLSTADQRKI